MAGKILEVSMKFNNRKLAFKITVVFTFIIAVVVMKACKPISGFMNMPEYEKNSDSILDYPKPVDSLKTIILIADNNGTEIFDLLGPYYLLNLAADANIFIVSKKDDPITLYRGLMIMPHHTFESFSKINVDVDAIVIPNLSTMMPDEIDAEIVDFIKKQKKEHTFILSVCDGAATAAKTGLYDGSPITTHSADLSFLQKKFPAPHWIENVRYTKSGKLISTAGVSNAIEGALVLIEDLYGLGVKQKVAAKINYPFDEVVEEHIGSSIGASDYFIILKKLIFNGKDKIAFLLTEGVSEFHLAASLDTFSRTFPYSLDTYTINSQSVTSRYGLKLIPSSNASMPNKLYGFESISSSSLQNNETAQIIALDTTQGYYFNYLLNLVNEEYGKKYSNTVSKLLDYDYLTNTKEKWKN